MAKTFIVGDDSLRDYASSLGASFISIPSPRPNTHEDIHDFMMNILGVSGADTVVLDADTDARLCLDLAMHIRLSLDFLGMSCLCPIIFLSDLGIDSLLKATGNSQLFLTSNTYVVRFNELRSCLDNAIPMKIGDYRRFFLSRITVVPPAYGESDRHGLANQWGASVMYRLLTGHEYSGDACKALVKAKKELYFKYILACTSDDLQSLVIPGKRVALPSNAVIDSHGKKILLIDDMVENGWLVSLSELLPGASIDVISESVTDFSEFSPEAQARIRNEEYDLYLLDLRLGGVREEEIYETLSFSGMKVLHEIKRVNRGRQVIMFTASNKAWNFKALLHAEAGANGYYIKESPSFKFTETFSQKSLETFSSEIKACYERNYLKSFYNFIVDFFTGPLGENALFDESRFQLEIAFGLSDNASSASQYRYAYISAIQVFELMYKYLVNVQRTSSNQILTMRNQRQMNIEHVREIRQDVLNPLMYIQDSVKDYQRSFEEMFSQFDKLAAIYLQYLGKADTGILWLVDQLVKVRNKIMHGVIEEERIIEESRTTKIDRNLYETRYRNLLPIFHDNEMESLMVEIIDSGCLMEYSNGRRRQLMIHKSVADSRLGLQLILCCLKTYFYSFE